MLVCERRKFEIDSVLDFWDTSKYLIRDNHLLSVSGAKSDQWRGRYWPGYSNLVERFLPFIPLDRRIHYLQKMTT